MPLGERRRKRAHFQSALAGCGAEVAAILTAELRSAVVTDLEAHTSNVVRMARKEESGLLEAVPGTIREAVQGSLINTLAPRSNISREFSSVPCASTFVGPRGTFKEARVDPIP